MQLEMPSLMDAFGIALIILGAVLLCGALLFARRRSPQEPDKDEAEHNERNERNEHDGPRDSETPRRGRESRASPKRDL